MSQVPAGWRNDPYGRFEQRYWDGERWTEHVVTGGVQQVDPLGATTVIPIATPPTAFAAPAPSSDPANGVQAAAATGKGDGLAGFLHRIGPDVHERPEPRLRTALAGLGGLIVAVGIAVVAAPERDPRGALIAISAVVLAAAVAVRLLVRSEQARAAATGAAAAAIPTFAISVTVSDGSSDTLTYLLLFALYAAAWALPGFRGRNLFLGLAALSLVGALGSLTESGSDGGVVPGAITNNVGTQGAIYLLAGGAFLGAAWWLDRRRFRGAGTAMAASGSIASLVGTVLVVDDLGNTSGPLLMVLVGSLVCVVGSHGSRRGTTWWGAALTSVGTVAFLVSTFEPTSKGAVGATVLAAGLLLVVVPLLGEPLRRAREQNQATSGGSGARP